MKSAIALGLLACAAFNANAESPCQTVSHMFEQAMDSAIKGEYYETARDKMDAIATREQGPYDRSKSNQIFDGFGNAIHRDVERMLRVADRFITAMNKAHGEKAAEALLKPTIKSITLGACGSGPLAGIDAVNQYALQLDMGQVKATPAPSKPASTAKKWEKDYEALQGYRMSPGAAKVAAEEGFYNIRGRVGAGAPVVLTLIEEGDVSGPEARDVVSLNLQPLGRFTGVDEHCTISVMDRSTAKKSATVEATRWDNSLSTSDPRVASVVKSAKKFAINFNCGKDGGVLGYAPSNSYSSAAH